MSSYFDDASLVMIPSGYKTSKVYSVKPTDGTGDLTFTRSNDTASRVASNGLIETVRTNLALQSEAFDNASWSKTTTTVTANTTTAPNGTLTADKLVAAVGAGTAVQHRVDQTTVSAAGAYTFSVYAKKAETQYIFLRIGASLGAYCDLNNGQILGVSVGITAKSEDAGNGWYRIIITNAAASANEVIRINLAVTVGNLNFIGNGTDGAFIWGAQYEATDFGATAYIPTTTAAVSVGPVANVPRLDYLNSSCPRLLLEPQATALNQFSESFDNAFWIKNDVTISANTTETLDPAGYYGADKVVETATPARHRVAAGSTTISAANHTASVFMKKGTARYGFVTFSGAAVSTIVVDLENGTITSTSTSGTIVAQKVENYGSGWYRISVTALGTATTTTYTLQFGSAGSATPSYTSNIPSFTGSTSNYLYAWGANLTATSYLQSYVPTLGAAVTRGADSMTKSAISGLIGQTEGVIFMDFVYSTPEQTRININSGSSQNWVFFGAPESVTSSRVYIRASGIVSVDTTTNLTGVFVVGQRYKVALAYKSGDWAIAINGTIRTSGTQTFTFNAPLTTAIFSGNLTSEPSAQQGTNNVNQALLFKTRLTNQELQDLTTL